MERSEKTPKHDISDMPDCVLSYILSKCPIKDLVKSSVLSKEWWNIWALRRDLTFDIPNMFGSHEMNEFNYPSHMPGSCCGEPAVINVDDVSRFDRPIVLPVRVKCEFVRRVNQFMKHFQGEKVDSLRVAFLLDAEHRDVVDQWISSAIARGVEQIDLLFSSVPYRLRCLPYRFPHWLFSEGVASRLLHLNLQSCLLDLPAVFSGFCKIRTLKLKEMTLGEDLFACLFSGCLLLQDLIIINCELPSSLKIVCPSLRHLKLLRCGRVKWEISTLNLASFEYIGDDSNISSIHSPALASIFTSPSTGKGTHCAFEQSANLPMLEILFVQLNAFDTIVFPKSFHPHRNLKQLMISPFRSEEEEIDYLWILTLVFACPLLQKLSLIFVTARFLSNQREIRQYDGFTHKQLKVFEMSGCMGNVYEVEFATHLLKNVETLEKMVISPSYRVYLGDGRWLAGGPDVSWLQTRREFVSTMLQGEVSRRTQLVIL